MREGTEESTATLVFADAENVVGVWRDAFLQLRRGALSLRMLDYVSLRTKQLRLQNPNGIALLTLLEAGADIPTPEVRAAQGARLREIFTAGTIWSAVVVEGDELHRQLRTTAITSTRTAAQLTSVQIERTVAAAARHVAKLRGGVDQLSYARGLERAIDSLRTRYHVRTKD